MIDEGGLSRERLLRGVLSGARHLAIQNPAFDVDALLSEALDLAAHEQDVLPVASQALELSRPEVFSKALARLVDLGTSAGPLRMLRRVAAESLCLMESISQARTRAVVPVKNRVAYISYSSLPYQSTGYTNRTQFLARGLREQGLDLHVITRPGYPWDEAPDALDRPAPRKATPDIIGGVPYHRIKTPGYFTWNNHANYIRRATDALEAVLRRLRPALVIGASNHACAMPALLAARRLGLPFVNEVRGFWEDSRAAREPDFAGSRQYLLERHWDSEVARSADVVVTLGAAMKRELVARGVTPARIGIVPNGAVERALPTTTTGVPVIGYVGSVTTHEGLELLIAACGRLRRDGMEFRLSLVGDDKGTGASDCASFQTLLDMVASEGLSDWTHAPGRVSPDAAREALDQLDIAVFPRHRSRVTDLVTPLKPIEAMMAGKAIVASDVGGFDALLRHGETALRFPAGDVDALTSSLRRLLEEGELRRKLGQNARAVAAQKYRWSSICADYVTSLSNLMREDADAPV